MTALDLYATSPEGLYPQPIKLRVLVYAPFYGPPGVRFRVHACDPKGKPLAEDPILAVEGVDFEDVQQFLDDSKADGWIFTPRVAPGAGYHPNTPKRSARPKHPEPTGVVPSKRPQHRRT